MSQQLRCFFVREASRWSKEHPVEGKKLAEEILYLEESISAAGASGGVGELIVAKIRSLAQRGAILPEVVVECMFEVSTADDVMSFFQLA